MNTRRQTVWLVSMLGLMVVLSAYYLFTDDADQLPMVTEQTSGNEIVVEGVGMMDPTAAQLGEIDIQQIAALEETEADGENAAEPLAGSAEAGPETGTETGSEAAPEAAAGTAPGAAEETAVATDQEVLEQLANMSGTDAITAMQIERDSFFSKQIEELTAALANENASEEELTAALNKQSELMDLEAKMIAFEEKLLGNYENVAVTYDSGKQHYTINVSAAELEKSEAVSIVTEAMHDLNIALHQISVRVFH